MNTKIYGVLKTLKRIERIENSWTCEIPKKDRNGKIVGKKITHLRSVSPSIGELLRFFILSSKSKKILELGCSAGYSTLWMSIALTEQGSGHIYTTEIIPEKAQFAKKNFKECDVEKLITLYERDILDVLTQWDNGRIDFVFIDADKNNYSNYYDKIYPLLKCKGLLICDNIISHANELKGFINKLKKDKRIIFYILPIDSGLVLIYKK